MTAVPIAPPVPASDDVARHRDDVDPPVHLVCVDCCTRIGDAWVALCGHLVETAATSEGRDRCDACEHSLRRRPHAILRVFEP